MSACLCWYRAMQRALRPEGKVVCNEEGWWRVVGGWTRGSKGKQANTVGGEWRWWWWWLPCRGCCFCVRRCALGISNAPATFRRGRCRTPLYPRFFFLRFFSSSLFRASSPPVSFLIGLSRTPSVKPLFTRLTSSTACPESRHRRLLVHGFASISRGAAKNIDWPLVIAALPQLNALVVAGLSEELLELRGDCGSSFTHVGTCTFVFVLRLCLSKV